MEFVGKDSVEYFRLASLRGMLKMEQAGLKTRGGALRPRLSKELGLNPRYSHDLYIAEVERRMAGIKEKLAAVQ